MRSPQLDERLSIAAELFPACDYGADIGADHGRLSCWLLSQGKCRRMCVADISEASLEKAKKLLTLHRLSDRADLCIGDGLTVLHCPAQAVAILGMGGKTLSGILANGKNKLQGAVLILSAHTEVFLVRETLSCIGYRIETERITRANRRYYTVMRAVPGEESYTKKQLYLGPRLMENGGGVFADFLKWQFQVLSSGRDEEARQRLTWIKEELEHAGDGEADRRDSQ